MTKYRSNMNTSTIVTTIAKYHSPTTLVTDTIVTKHHSHNIGHLIMMLSINI
jgi:hypothetical protein